METLGLRTKAVLNCFLGFLEHRREGRRFTSFTATRSLEKKVVQNASGWVKCPTLGVRWGALEAVCVGGGCVCFICAENAAAAGPGGGSGCPAEPAGFLLLSDSCRGRAACCLLRGGVCRLCWWTLGSGQRWRTGELDLPHAATACSVQPRSLPGTAQRERPVSFSAAPPREISIRDEERDRPHYTPVDRGDSSASPPVGWQCFCTPLVRRAGRESTRLPPSLAAAVPLLLLPVPLLALGSAGSRLCSSLRRAFPSSAAGVRVSLGLQSPRLR